MRAFVNETYIVSKAADGVMVFKTVVPLNITTAEYIRDRDEREIEYIKLIEQLKLLRNQKE
ncbi:MAG: hypothetical protein ACP5MG_12950 [Verrucomicrobiia bacterium]|jgi:hypothetical protein